MLPIYDCGDGLHPSDLGYNKMGVVPFIPLGQYRARAGFRSYLTGVVDAPIAFLWNIEKRK
jgi:hypothetical protein